MNRILTVMALLAVVFGVCSDRTEEVSTALLQKCGDAVPLVLSLTGALCLWSGLMEVAEESGLTRKIAALFRPLTGRLLPAFRRDDRVLGLVSMNITANLLGLGNAATPLGLAALREMTAKTGKTATREVITLVVLNTCSVQLIPATAAAMRLAAGSSAPMEILPAVLASSALSLAVSLGLVAACARLFPDRKGGQ